MSEAITNRILEHLRARPEHADVLRRAIKLHEENEGKRWLGGEWHEVKCPPATLNSLVVKDILDVSYNSSTSTCYKLVDVEATKKALEIFDAWKTPITPVEKEIEEEKIPSDLFDIVVGHEEKKEIILRSLEADRPVHPLLVGTIATAKTLMLEELSRLPNSKSVLGSSLTKAGILEILFEEQPRYLIIDELDKIDDTENLTALLSLMQTGRISETKYHKHRSIKLKTWVFASANKLTRIQGRHPELISRFLPLRFREYTLKEFIEVVTHILPMREDVPKPLANYIAKKVLRELRSKDVRDATKVARLLRKHTKEEVDHIIQILRRQK